jgi:hypothetical protein
MVDATWPTTAGDGSLLLCYYAGRRGYFKRVSRTGAIAGGFGPSGIGCPLVFGYRSGFIGTSDLYLPFKRSLDLSNPHHITWLTSEEPERRPRAGDVYLGACSDSMSDDDPRYVQYQDVGCAYSPEARALFRMVPVLAVDARGRTWSVSGRTLVVSDGARRWQSQPFPGRPVTVLTSDGDTAAVFLSDDASSIFVTNDAGRSWHRVTGVPEIGGEGLGQNILPDGRLLLGPVNDQIWRGTDATTATSTFSRPVP